MGKYAIYTLFDNKYFEYGLTFIYSFFKFNGWFNGDFFIINDDRYSILSEENKEKIRKISRQISFLNIKSEEYKDVFENYKKINPNSPFFSCFYKLEIFKDKGCDRTLWLDGDMLINDSIQELFENKEYNGKFCACLDPISNVFTTEPFIRNSDENYFNGGLFLIDKGIIKTYSYDKMCEYCKTVTKEELIKNRRAKFNGGCADQDCFNCYIKDSDTLLLPALIYNINYTTRGVERWKGKPKIFHYCGNTNKPNGFFDKKGKCPWFYEPWHKLNKEVMELIKG